MVLSVLLSHSVDVIITFLTFNDFVLFKYHTISSQHHNTFFLILADSVESDEPQLLDMPSSSSEELLARAVESETSAEQEDTEVKKEEDRVEDVLPL